MVHKFTLYHHRRTTRGFQSRPLKVDSNPCCYHPRRRPCWSFRDGTGGTDTQRRRTQHGERTKERSLQSIAWEACWDSRCDWEPRWWRRRWWSQSSRECPRWRRAWNRPNHSASLRVALPLSPAPPWTTLPLFFGFHFFNIKKNKNYWRGCMCLHV